jgi:hypothetical protein
LWQGVRHDWNVRRGQIAPEILDWLQTDPVFISGSAEWEQIGYTFQSADKRYKTEEGRKMIIAGSAGGQAASVSLCGLSLKCAIPAARVNAWFRAFRNVNSALCCNVVVIAFGARLTWLGGTVSIG